MSPKHNFKNFGEVNDFNFLEGTIKSVDGATDTCTVEVTAKDGSKTTYANVLLFYHCTPTSALRENGAIQGASAGFTIDDEVIFMKSLAEGGVHRVIGHIDGIWGCSPCRALVDTLWYTGHEMTDEEKKSLNLVGIGPGYSGIDWTVEVLPGTYSQGTPDYGQSPKVASRSFTFDKALRNTDLFELVLTIDITNAIFPTWEFTNSIQALDGSGAFLWIPSPYLNASCCNPQIEYYDGTHFIVPGDIICNKFKLVSCASLGSGDTDISPTVTIWLGGSNSNTGGEEPYIVPPGITVRLDELRVYRQEAPIVGFSAPYYKIEQL